MSTSQKTIESYRDQIAEWRSQGVSLRNIADQLKMRGLDIDHNIVNRYCKKEGIPAAASARPEREDNAASPEGGLPAASSPGENGASTPLISSWNPPKEPLRERANTHVFEGVRAGPQISIGTGAASLTVSLIETASAAPQVTEGPSAVQPAPTVREVNRVTAAPKFPSPLSPVKRPLDFPEINSHRLEIGIFVSAGYSAEGIQFQCAQRWGLHASIEQFTDYIEAILREVNPPGQVASNLLTMFEQTAEWKNDAPIFGFGDVRSGDVWKLSDFFEGTLILGASGSGKTTGSARNLARAFLQAGFGGLVLTTKPGEAIEWIKMAMLTNRDNSLHVIRADAFLRLDVLTYECQRPGQGGRLTENLLHFFKNLVSVLSVKRGYVTNAAFWQSTGDQLLRNLLTVFLAANLPVTIEALSQFLTHAPLNANDAQEDQWRQIPVFGPCLAQAEEYATTEEARNTFQKLKEYWLHYYPSLPSETRACITIGFAAMVDSLRSPTIQKLIASQTTITPEGVLGGDIVIVDLPINDYHEAGLLVQTAWKYLFQRAALNRADKNRGNKCRPAFLWEDECQNFLIDYDAEFNRVARDCRIARVMITQNINNLFDAYGGGDAARVKVESILGTLNTRIFHANGDLATNKWASESIGTHEKHFTETSTTPPQYHGWDPIKSALFKMFKKPSVTTNTHRVRESVVHPHEFSQLRPGGRQNGMMPEAVITQVGRRFADGRSFSKVEFKQIIFPEQDFATREELQAAMRG